MLAVFAMLSDIPAYIAAFVSQLTGADMSGFVNFFNDGIAKVFEIVETLIGGRFLPLSKCTDEEKSRREDGFLTVDKVAEP